MVIITGMVTIIFGQITLFFGHIYPQKVNIITFFCTKVKNMMFLGIDLGSSSVKVSLFDGEKNERLKSVSYPSDEMEILSPEQGFAEQNPMIWIENLHKAVQILKKDFPKMLAEVKAIGISYQMHGLVTLNKKGELVRNAIIWCDSRAVSIGENAYRELGTEFCNQHYLNSPGNFTASKLSWVRENEPEKFEEIDKFMLPGDFILYHLTGTISTTAPGLSEGILWDYENEKTANALLHHYKIDSKLIPPLSPTFGEQGLLDEAIAKELGLTPGIPVTYRAGDQPNNALSLNVFHPGDVAATGGTSGVIYGVTDQKRFDPLSRINTFLHVNHKAQAPRLGILLCLNSVGILNAWARQELLNKAWTYDEMNARASEIAEGAGGIFVLPFGNGAERALENKNIGVSFHDIDMNTHSKWHIVRAIHEGIAFAFYYGLEIMKEAGVDPKVIKAGYGNMFMSPVFNSTLANLAKTTIELYNTNGAEGAARGAGIGLGYYQNYDDAFKGLKVIETIQPNQHSNISKSYQQWKTILHSSIQ